MPVAWAGADNLPLDKWVHVRGTVKVQQFGKNALPVIDAIKHHERLASTEA